MTQIFSVQCPYCNHSNVLMHDTTKREEVQIFYCDNDYGDGCGKAFAVKSLVEIVSTVYELKASAEVSNANA